MCLLLEELQFVFHVSNFSSHEILPADLDREAASLSSLTAGPSQDVPYHNFSTLFVALNEWSHTCTLVQFIQIHIKYCTSVNM